MANVDQRVAQFIQVRDALKKMDERHEQERKPLVDVQTLLSGWLQQALTAAKAMSIKTPHGTCIASTRHTASVADADAFMKFVIANQEFDLLDRRANSTACREYAEKHLQPPPGVNISSIQTIGVRRPTGKAADPTE